jgi:hypothetical protein
MSKSKQQLTYIRTKLSEVYEITVDPEMKYYLGHHIVRDRQKKKIYLDQTAMINDIAQKFQIPLSGPFPSTPMEYLPQDPSDKELKTIEKSDKKMKEFREFIVDKGIVLAFVKVLLSLKYSENKPKNPIKSMSCQNKTFLKINFVKQYF